MVVDGRVVVVSWWVGCSVMIGRFEFRIGKLFGTVWALSLLCLA